MSPGPGRDGSLGQIPVTPTLRIRIDWRERHRLELYVKDPRLADPRLAGLFPNGEITWEIPLGRSLIWLATLTNLLRVKYREKELL